MSPIERNETYTKWEQDAITMLLLHLCALLICLYLGEMGYAEDTAPVIFVLAVFLTGFFTNGYLWSLLGSLLFGGGFNGGGFLDIILIGGLLFLAFKFFSRRRAATQGAGQPNAGGFDSLRSTPGSDSTHQRTAAPQSGKGGFDWEALTTPSSGQQPLYQDEPKKPAGFDEEEFLRGAKAAYTRLNNAWDKRDLSDIAQFSTPAFQKEIQQQAAEDKTPGNTEIMLVNASLLSVDTVGDEQIAQVYFNVLLREDPSQEAPIDVREIWHFVRPASGDGTWKLDGIQQVENV